MDKKKIEKFIENLKEECRLLEEELKTVGRINPSNPDDWEAVGTTNETDSADRNKVADEIADYENNTGILKNLEIRYNEVTKALEKIKTGEYGACEVCKECIEHDRLQANPAALTCKAHMN